MSRGDDDLKKRVIYLVQCIEKELEDGPATTANQTKQRKAENEIVDDEYDQLDKSADVENDRSVVIELEKKSQSDDSGIRNGDASGVSDKPYKKGRFERGNKQKGKFGS